MRVLREPLTGLRADPRDPAAVLVPLGGSRAALDEAGAWAGIGGSPLVAWSRASKARPSVYVDDGHVAVRVLPAPEAGESVTLLAVPGGLLIVADAQLLAGVSPTVEGAGDDPLVALASLMRALARVWEAAIDDLAQESEALAQRAIGFSSGALRAQTAQLRARLLTVQGLALGHQRLVERGGELAEATPEQGQRARRDAEAVFGAAEAHAAQLYSVLGDALQRQAAVVNERLTLVATIFLPLTVAVGFFGMNFGWMTDHIGSAASFFLLGIGVPLLLVVAGLALTRRVGAEPTESRRFEHGRAPPADE